MQRKTLTTLNQLRAGDSFVFLKKDEPWRVTSPVDKNGRVSINKFIGERQVLKFDEVRKGTTQVVFLRHTLPISGEECFVEDLNIGDVFHKTDNVITEYTVVEKGHEFYTVQPTVGTIEKAGRLATVVMVRRRGEVCC